MFLLTHLLITKKAEKFKALSNPIKLNIIDVLADGERCVYKIIEKLNKYKQPHISKSLTKLKCEYIKEFISCLNNIIQ